MINTITALNLFMQKFKEKYGDNYKLEENKCCIAVFNNCILTMTIDEETKKMNLTFDGGQPIFINEKLDIYEPYNGENHNQNDKCNAKS